MKLIFLIVFAAIINFSALSYAQEDTTKAKAKSENKIEKPAVKETDPSFKKQKRKKDVFIDKDGDGICDNRANGMSFEKFRKRHQFQKKGSSGNQGGKR